MNQEFDITQGSLGMPQFSNLSTFILCNPDTKTFFVSLSKLESTSLRTVQKRHSP